MAVCLFFVVGLSAGQPVGKLALSFLAVKADHLHFLFWSQLWAFPSQFRSCPCQSKALGIPHSMVVRPLAGHL